MDNAPVQQVKRLSEKCSVSAPVWYADVAIPEFESDLGESVRTDVCAVGAGIAGLTTAYLLARAGKQVIVIDEKQVGGGESGRTSAHLASALDDRFSRLEQIHGQEATRHLLRAITNSFRVWSPV